MKKFIALMCVCALAMGAFTGFEAEAKIQKTKKAFQNEKMTKINKNLKTLTQQMPK